MYTNIFVNKKDMVVHLWDDTKGYTTFPFSRYAYRRQIGGPFKSLYGDELERITSFDERDPTLFESDVLPEMRVLIDAYEDSDEPSKGVRVVVLDIETDSAGGFPNIMEGDKAVTAIAFYDQMADKYYSYILDVDRKIASGTNGNLETRSFICEENLLAAFLDKWNEISPNIVTGWNCIPVKQSVWLRNKIVPIGKLSDTKLFDSTLVKKSIPTPKEKWEIQLVNGQVIHSSGDHKFPVKIVNPNEYITFNVSNKSNFIDCDLKTRQIKSFNECMDVYCAIQLRTNDNVDNPKYSISQLYLAGLIYTDGSLKDKLHTNYGYTFYQSDETFMNKLDVFGVDGKLVGPYKGCYSRHIKYGLIGDAHELIYDKTNKQLNLTELSTLSYTQFASFLSGLLDGDGYKSNGKFEWCNYNGDLDILHELCNWNGIFCSQRKHSLRFFNLKLKDLSLLKEKRWDNFNPHNTRRNSKQKSLQTKFKQIGDVVWVKVKSVKYVGSSTSMMDIETNTHYFVSKGIRTHNCNNFDLPYLHNRIRAVLGKNEGYRLSPIRISYQNKFNKRMTIAGVSCLDYLELYKKFLGVMKSSYSLGNVAKDEGLKTQKITYRGSLNDLYKSDIKRYAEYNLTDVRVVVELDKKYDFIYLARSVCHKGHVPYEWFQMSSRFIDGAILTYLSRHNMIGINKPIGGREEYEKMERGDEDGFTGAYVKEPIAGLYDWIYSADITSLYPSTIMTLNISPETKIGKIDGWNYEQFAAGNMPIIRIGDQQSYSLDDFRKMIANYSFSVSSNGVVYRQDLRGVVPTILDLWFNERVEYRALAAKYSKEGDKEKEAFYDRRQKRQKIFLNSVYGTLGLPVFRFYDRDNAEAVTISGQTIILSAEKLVNRFYKEKYDAKGKVLTETDFVKYIDTDSLYVSAIPLAKLEETPPDMTKFTIDLVKEVSAKINRFYQYMVPKVFNVAPEKNRIKIVPDVVAKKALWVAKKRYAMLKVYDMEKLKPVKDKEGKEGKLEVKGIDTVRSSYPAAFRTFAGEILDLLLRGTPREVLDEKIMKFEETIDQYSILDLSKTSSVRFISKSGEINYNPGSRRPFQFVVGSPAQVRAALSYNDFLKVWKLDKQVEKIESGAKVKWVYVLPNDFNIEALAMKADETDPDQILEFISTHVDRHKMYERELHGKLEEIWKVIGWSYPNRGSQLASKVFNFEEVW